MTVGATGIYIVDTGEGETGCIYRLGDDCSLTPVATNAPIADPTGIATDPITGDLFVADAHGQRLLRVNPETGATSPIVTGLSLLWGQACVDVTPDGRQVFVTNRGSLAILTFTVRTAADYAKAIEEEPNDPIHRLQRARFHAFRGDSEKALVDFNKAVELGPDESVTWMWRAHFHADQGRTDQALDDFGKAQALAPDNWRIWRDRGEVHEKLDQWDKAIADYCTAIELAPEEWPFWKTRADQFAQSEEWVKAITLYTSLVEHNPDNWELWNARATVHNQRKQWDRAIEDCGQAIKLRPDAAQAWGQRAHAYYDLKQWDKAFADFNEAIRRAPEDRGLYDDRCKTYLRLGRYDEALADWNRYVELRPDSATAARIRALLLLIADRTDEYRQACVEILDRFAESEDPEVFCDAARACVLAPKAIPDPMVPVELATRAVSRDPSATTLYTLGMAHLRAGQLDEAAQRFRESLRADPNWNLRFLNWLGLALVQHERGKTEEARQWLGKAIESMEQDPAPAFLERIEGQLLRREVEQLLEKPEQESDAAKGEQE